MVETREEGERLIEPYELRANMFPTHAELVIHMVAGDMQEICRLARLGLSCAFPSEAEIERMARAYRDQIDEACEALEHPRAPARKAASAKIAKIPFALSSWIAKTYLPSPSQAMRGETKRSVG